MKGFLIPFLICDLLCQVVSHPLCDVALSCEVVSHLICDVGPVV